MNIRIAPKSVLRFLLCCIGVLIFLDCLALTGKFGFGYPTMKGFFNLVILDAENNIPTCYSGFVIFLCFMVLSLIAFLYWKDRHQFKYHWMGLAALFLLLAFDELMQIHERLDIFRESLSTTGAFFFSWVIPALALLPVFLAAYVKFLLDLPRATARLFLLSGGIFISGAVGMEMVVSKIFYTNLKLKKLEEPRTLLYEIGTLIEEGLEMLGMALFLFALLSFLEKKVGSIQFSLKN